MASANMTIRILGDVTDAKNKLRELDASVSAFGTNLQTKMASADNGFTKFGAGLTKLGSGMQQLGAGLTTYVSMPLALLGGAAMKVAVDFEKAFAGVRKTVDEGTSVDGKITDYATLRQSLISLSGQLGVSKEDLAAIMQMAGQLGIRGNESLATFTEAVAKLNLTTEIAPEQLSQLLGKLVAITGLDVETEMMKLADTITALGNNSATTENDILKFSIRMAAAGKLIGLTVPQILALGAASESTGTKAERGGSAMTKIFMAIQAEVSRAYVTTGEYSKIVKESGQEQLKATETLNDAIVALDNYKKSGGGAGQTMDDLTKAVADARSEVDTLSKAYDDMDLALKVGQNELGGFAQLIGLTSAEMATLSTQDGGGMLIMQRFIDAIDDARRAGVDIKGLMKSLGLGDTRLIQAVESLASANGDAKISTSDLMQALGLAESAWAGYGDAVGAADAEVLKRLDTTSAQLSIFKEQWKSLALVFTNDVNGGLKELLKTVNALMQRFLDWLTGMEPEKLQALVSNVVKGFVTLIALGPGLSIFGTFLKSFGTLFGVIGLGIDGANQKLGLFKGFLSSLKKTSVAVEAVTGDQQSPLAGVSKVFASIEAGVLKVGSIISGDKDGLIDDVVDTNGDGQQKLQTLKDPKTGKFMKTPVVDQPMSNITTGLGTDQGITLGGSSVGLDPEDFGPDSAPAKKPAITRMLDGIKKNFLMFGTWFKVNVLGKFSALFAKFGSSFKTMVDTFMGTKLGLFFQSVAFQLQPIIVFVQSIMPAFLSASLKLAGILMGWAVALALIAGGLAVFFVMTGKSATDVQNIFDGLTEKVTTFFTNVQNAVPNVMAKIDEFAGKFGPVFGAVVSGITKMVVSFINSFFTLLPVIITAAGTLISGLIGGFIKFLPQLLNSGVQIIMALLQGLWKALPSIIAFAFKVVFSLINGLISSLPMIFKALGDMWAGIIGFLWQIVADGSLFRIAGQIIWGLITGLFSVLGSLWNAVVEIVGTFIGWFLSLFGIHSPSTVFAEIGGFLIQGLWDGIVWVWNLLIAFWKGLPKLLLDVFLGVGKWLWDTGKKLLTGLWDGLWWYWTTVFKIGLDLWKWITDVTGDGLNVLKDIGGNLLKGLWNGITGTGTWLKTKWDGFWGGLAQGAKDIFGIKSPSRVFKGIGENIGLGFISGIDSMTGAVEDSANKMAMAAMIDPRALSQAIDVNADGTVTSKVDGLTDSLVTALTAVGLDVYIDKKLITDVIGTELALQTRRKGY